MSQKKNKKTTQKAVRSRRTTKYPSFRPVADQHFFSLEEEQHFFSQRQNTKKRNTCPIIWLCQVVPMQLYFPPSIMSVPIFSAHVQCPISNARPSAQIGERHPESATKKWVG